MQSNFTYNRFYVVFLILLIQNYPSAAIAQLNDSLSITQKRKRTLLVSSANLVGYGCVMIGLNSAWYKNYPKSKFHSFNDIKEWNQMDKAGHLYSAYIESKLSMEMWRWTGMERKKRIWIGGLSGAFYQTVIETLDGFSAGWGWSWGDIGANFIGSGSLIAQELAWDEQRIKIKFSFHKKNYSDAELIKRSNDLFGSRMSERFLKDYNGQTYWASVNISDFSKQSNWPKWLNLSLGYGSEGMFGGTENKAIDETGNITFYRPDIKRYRQWYISPDIDFTKIRTKKKGVKMLFTVLSAFKFPAPTLEFSNGKLKLRPLYF